ncbi:MAG TPA: SMP-30/gluconolactonase/LRE family protein [Steroidobacteraceae bacterium]|jgi:gluconolactonase|nr:SMP-30/gluconolactonase/LRE family protein [Steroidobacteraceae bacterium]
MNRRSFLNAAAAAAVGSVAATPALARSQSDPPGTTPPPRNWNDPASVAYPDPAIEAFDSRFKKYVVGTTEVRRLWSGAEWTEGPVYFGDMHSVIFSDVPNNRLMRYDEVSGETTLFRYPSNEANGNTRDRQGRLVTCEQRTRRVTRTGYDGSVTVLADHYRGKRLNSPNGVVVKSDGTVWFTDPSYGIQGDHEGWRAKPELPGSVYRFDPRNGRLTAVADDYEQPNAVCFSPDEKRLYVSETSGPPSYIRVYDVSDDGTLTHAHVLHDLADTHGGIADDIRVDEDGNLWCAGGWSPDKDFNGVSVFAPDGTPIGRIVLPEVAANLCFGGYEHNRSRLYICASTSLYAAYVGVRGLGV